MHYKSPINPNELLLPSGQMVRLKYDRTKHGSTVRQTMIQAIHNRWRPAIIQHRGSEALMVKLSLHLFSGGSTSMHRMRGFSGSMQLSDDRSDIGLALSSAADAVES